MKLTLTAQELLRRRKLVMGLASASSIYEAEDSSALDEMLLNEIETWYANLLRTAPPELLPTERFETEAEVRLVSDRYVEVPLPERLVRPTAVALSDWRGPLRHILAHDPQILNYLEAFSYLPHSQRPIAMLCGDVLRLYGYESSAPRLTLLEGVARPENGLYILDSSLLPTSLTP